MLHHADREWAPTSSGLPQNLVAEIFRDRLDTESQIYDALATYPLTGAFTQPQEISQVLQKPYDRATICHCLDVPDPVCSLPHQDSPAPCRNCHCTNTTQSDSIPLLESSYSNESLETIHSCCRILPRVHYTAWIGHKDTKDATQIFRF